MTAPTRSCVACRRRSEQSRLLRLAVRDDAVAVDPPARLPGRGAYLCQRHECLEAATRRDGSLLRRALRAGAGTKIDVQALHAAWAANKR